MRGLFLFTVSAMLAIVIGCVDQAARDEANSAQPAPVPGVSMYPLSTPPPAPVEAQPQYFAQPVPTPYTSSSPYTTPYTAIYAPTSPYATTYSQPADAPLVIPDPPSVTLPSPGPTPYSAQPQPAPTPYMAPPSSGPTPYISEPYVIPGDASPVSSPYDNVILTPPPQPAPVIITQPLPAATTYQAPAPYPVPGPPQQTPTYIPPPAAVSVPATTAALPGGFRLVPATDIPPGNRPGDFLPSQWFEIVRPGDGPIRIGRVSSSCVCVGVRVPNRQIGQGERALVEARIVSKPARNNLTYVIFVNVAEPRAELLDADVTITW